MSAEIEPGFKLTEAGLIPLGWDSLPLSEALNRGRLGGNYENSERATFAPLMKMGNISRGLFSLDKVEYIQNVESIDPSHRLNKGDVLFNTRNTLDLVGKVAIWRDELPIAYFNSNLMRLEFDKSKIASAEYANYALNSKSSISRLKAIATGTTSVAAIYTRDLLAFCIPAPPKAEQVAIGNVLSDIDALISSLDQLIAKKRDIQQAAMQQLLTGQRRLPGFSGEWEVKRFGEVVACRSERVDPRLAERQDFCVELEHIEPRSGRLIGHTSADESSSLKAVFKYQDVLFGKLRAYQRKYWLAGREGVCSTEIWALSCDARFLLPDFLYHLVKTDAFIEAASTAYGTHMPRSDWKVVKQFDISLPMREEQTAIATILSDMDTELAALESRRDKARQLKQGMMQELLTGRIRLLDKGSV